MKVNILGTDYEVIKRTDVEDKILMECGGYCDWSTKEIVIAGLTKEQKKEPNNFKQMKIHEKAAIRHEIIHAFLFESGLRDDSCSTNAWAFNEEMVDWFAMQMPKLIEAFKGCNCL